MTRDEAIYAAKQRMPVICNGTRYRRISAVIFRYIGDTDRTGMAHNVPEEMLQVELWRQLSGERAFQTRFNTRYRAPNLSFISSL